MEPAQINNFTAASVNILGTAQPVLTIVGVGLISGSLSLSLKQHKLVSKVVGVSRTQKSADKALELGLIDEALDIQQAVKAADIIYVAIPVDATIPVMLQIMDIITPNQIVVDAGSTKYELCKALANHPMRSRYVSTHPMWGTEYSGPEAATSQSFAGRACVICEKEKTNAAALTLIEEMYKQLGMHITYMDSYNHDTHAAYISHISHITSFALANTVLEKEKEEDAIFQLAGGGFESTVRLANSNADMWVPIFAQNKENVLDVLNEHIAQLRKFKSCFEKENWVYLRELIEKANSIKKILK